MKGFVIDGLKIYSKNVSTGRFREEVNLDIYLKNRVEEQFLLYIKIFHYRKPCLKPWVEFFGISKQVKMVVKTINYFDSSFEYFLLSHFSKSLTPGGKIFVGYNNDEKTRKQLEFGNLQLSHG